MASVSNFRTSLRRYYAIDARNILRTKSSAKWSVKAAMLSRVTLCKKIRAQFRLWQVKKHVQTARESHDLNMDFRGFNQLHATNSMQEYNFYKTH